MSETAAPDAVPTPGGSLSEAEAAFATIIWEAQPAHRSVAGAEAVARQLLNGPVADLLARARAEGAAEALHEAAAAARGMHNRVSPDCDEWAYWLDERALRIARAEGATDAGQGGGS